MGDLRVVDIDMVDMRVVDMGMIVVGVVELEVVELVAGVFGEDCLREVEVMDKDYLMKVEVVMEGCLFHDPTHFSAYHRLGFDHQA